MTTPPNNKSKSTKPIPKTSAKSAPKSTRKKTATPKQQELAPNAPQKASWTKRFFITCLKLSLVALGALALYVIYLDAKAQDKFEGQRWQVPVQIYSHAEIISQGRPLSTQQLAEVLKRAGYQRVNKVWRAGQFAQSSKRIIIFRRAFELGNLTLDASKLTIDIADGRVSKLYKNESPVKRIQLEPHLVARMVSDDKEDRVLVGLEEVPESLLDTLLLVEDRDFYFHHGVSPLGIARALYQNIAAGRTVQGGSTLTQQLVKNMYLTRDKTLVRKFNEAIMSLLLEARYSKDQLLEAYINEVYLGQHYANGVYGFGLAAEFYFGKPIQQLTPAQMALLVGIIKGPSYYDPWRRPERAKKRRDLVLKLMVEHRLISAEDYQSAVDSNLAIRATRRLAKHGNYHYLKQVRRELPEILSGVAQNSGIKVLTGFSVLSQLALEEVAEQTLTSLENKHQQSDLQAAVLVTHHKTGELRALLGDRVANNQGFNRALSAKRPIGSLIKPAVYLPALEQYQRFNLATVIEDKALAITGDNGEVWRPKNYDEKFRDQVPLADGLVHSLNIPTVNLGMMLGLTTLNDVVSMLGYQEPLTERPSMLLGAINMSPFEINQLYLPIAKQGYYQSVHAVKEIISHRGETLWRYRDQLEQRISTNTAYLLNFALQQVTEVGTAKSLTWRLPGSTLAGKTGTTNDQRDSWFVGYDDQHLVTTWIGHDDNKPMKLTGSSGALVLFANYMKHIGVSSLQLKAPEAIAEVKFERSTGNAVQGNCKDVVYYPAVSDGLSYSDCMEEIEDKRSWWQKLFGSD